MPTESRRSAAATRDRILAAAFDEFSECGIAGARVDRIAAAANCNKNLIYVHFKSKEELFNTVLNQHLSRVHEALHFDPNNVPDYAGRVFDFAMANPKTMRLVAWFALEQRNEVAPERKKARDVKVSKLSKARYQSPFSPEFIVICTMALATAWSAASCFGPLLDVAQLKETDHLRRQVSEAVARIVA